MQPASAVIVAADFKLKIYFFTQAGPLQEPFHTEAVLAGKTLLFFFAAITVILAALFAC